MRKVLTVLVILVWVSLIGGVLYVGISLVQKTLAYNKEKADFTRNTSPLATVVIQDMCSKFAIPEADARCQPGATVYAVEFFDDIKTYFRGLPKERATVDEVERLLGPYQIYREPITRRSDGTGYYYISYDLKGDQVHRINCKFDEDGSLVDIMTTEGGS